MVESTDGADSRAAVEVEPEDPYGPAAGGCSSVLQNDGVFVFVADAGTCPEKISQWLDLVPPPDGYVLDGRVELHFTGPSAPGFTGPPGLGRGLCGTDVRP